METKDQTIERLRRELAEGKYDYMEQALAVLELTHERDSARAEAIRWRDDWRKLGDRFVASEGARRELLAKLNREE